MSEQPFQRLAWQNRWVRYIQQPLVGADCFQESVLLNPENNLIVLNLSEFEFTRLFSAIMTGAEISYPDESHQVMVDFLKGIQCPPELVADECVTLPSYANNIAYSPVNPYIEPDVIPDGYLTQPFLVNGQNGNDFPSYEPFDVIVPFGAITFDLNFFEDIAGQLPTVRIMVQGQGQVNIHFLTAPQGGLVVVTLDNPPNLIDILAGIVTGAENIVDLNQDLVSLPPETAKDLIFPVTIESAGIHTIYAVFLPILDDSLIPIRFGGGFRGLELCGFLPEGDMGIQNLRFLDCNLEQQNTDGSWSIVNGWEDWLGCVPSGGGGGVANIKVTTFDPILADGSTTNLTFTTIDTIFNITPVYSKMLVIVNNLTMSHSTGVNRTEARVVRATTNIGTYANVTSVQGTTGRQVTVSDLFENVPVGVNTAFQLQIRGTAAGTASYNNATQVNVTVIEFENAEDLFVQDIRYDSATREIQKKIAGVWITVTDSLAVTLNAIQAIANNAAAAAAAAQSTANNALTVANGAVTVNNTQNNRLNSLENDVNSIMTVDIPQINLTLADHETRIDALEAAIAGANTWGGYKLGSVTDLDLRPSLGRYTSPFSTFDTNPASLGWIPTANNDVDIVSANAMRLGAACFVRVTIKVLNYVSGTFSGRINGGSEALLLQNVGSGNNWSAWIPVLPNESADMLIEVSASDGGNDWRLNIITYVLLNYNPFTLQVLP